MRMLWLPILLAGCEATAPSSSVGDLFEPRREEVPVPVPDAPAPPPPADAGEEAFDFEADARSDDGERDLSDEALLAGLGLAPEEEASDEAGAAPVEPPEEAGPVVPEAPIDAEPPVASEALAEGFGGADWGVRLVSTVAGAQPPRAILGFAGGEEIVVEPGMLLPEHRLVVLAIGRDVVQVAEVTPAGDRARVETHLLPALYPSGDGR